MKTDELFYELFKFAPQSLFELLSIDIEGTCRFYTLPCKAVLPLQWSMNGTL
ncbi:Uncharacterized protein dnl_57580 [Desulfonema limicola]|uniref:Uncharacterized protein n=1 Tax=Desulfonema limicola TaxID=45656 RepID=A0A975BDB1_9BACT|nr:Uncharacterized protein dnl_32550 [Desulfonema limicola]QTA83356.1 Uncharacterized protein dnl_57580 [Desulfonema limicola]